MVDESDVDEVAEAMPFQNPQDQIIVLDLIEMHTWIHASLCGADVPGMDRLPGHYGRLLGMVTDDGLRSFRSGSILAAEIANQKGSPGEAEQEVWTMTMTWLLEEMQRRGMPIE